MAINFNTSHINCLLSSSQIGKALNCISKEAINKGFYGIAEKADKVNHEYSLMVHYFVEGKSDPSRTEMLAHILDDAYTLMDMLDAKITKSATPLSSIDYNNLSEFFLAIENNFPATSDDRKTIQQIILDDNQPLYLRGLTLSALTLNLLKHFDKEKFESLYTYTLDDMPAMVRARAWVAIVLVAIAHDSRIKTQPRLVELLKLICEEKLLFLIQIALIKCTEAKTIIETIKKDVIDKFNKGIAEIKSEAKDEIQLLWNEYMQKSNLNEKLQEILGKQKIGVDITYDSFKHMSRTNFFQNKENWFMPFDIKHPYIQKSIGNSKARNMYVQILSKAGNLCSTDKYSNLYVLNFLNEEQLGNVVKSLYSQEFLDSIEDLTLEDEVVNYIHDLYRYFTISVYERDSERNVFKHDMYFGDRESLKPVVNALSLSEMHLLADSFIETNSWFNAVFIMREIVNIDDSEENMRKYVYCMTEQDKTHHFLYDVLPECYRRFPESKWIIKAYADYLVRMHDYRTAESVLRKGMELFPKDTSLILDIVEIYYDYRINYKSASELLFRADLIKENSYPIVSKLARCLYELGDLEGAEKYICKTLSKKKCNDADKMLSGAISLANGDIKTAVERFRCVDQKYFENVYSLEQNKLLKIGVPIETIAMVAEMVYRHLT